MREHAVDLVISDMRMPEMDGARFLAQVRAHDAGIVHILLTGYADIGATVAAINQGEIHRYITKPWNDQDLVQVVRDALSRRDLERRNAELAALARTQNKLLREANFTLESRVAARTTEPAQINGMLEAAYGDLDRTFMLAVNVFSGLQEMREGSAGYARRVADLARGTAKLLGQHHPPSLRVCQPRWFAPELARAPGFNPGWRSAGGPCRTPAPVMSDMSLHRADALWAQELLAAIAVPAALHAGTHLIAANDALCRLSGRTLQDLQALPFEQWVTASDCNALMRACTVCLDDKASPPPLSARIVTPEGGELPVEIHARPLALGGVAAVVLTCVDQSDRLKALTSLSGLTEMLRQIVDGAPIASLVIDQNHRVTHWNSACEWMTGLTRQQMLGSRETWRAFYDHERPLLANLIVDSAGDPALLALYEGKARASSVTPGGLEAEAFFPRFGAQSAWLYFTATPLRDAQGQIIGAIETLQDVTERRRAQEELLRHRDELEQKVQQRSAELAATVRELERFVTYAPVGVVYTSEGVVQRVNGTTAGMFGYTEAQMKGMPGEQLYRSAEDYGDLGSHAADVLSRGEPLHHEMWMRHADGHPIWVQLDAPVADRGDTRRGTWWMMQDRTEIRNAQQQLQEHFEELHLTISKLEDAQNQLLQQDKMASIGQLAAGVAHEINNPVAFVRSNLNTLRRAVRSRFAPCPVPARPSASGCPSAGRSPCLPALCRRPGWRELRRAGRRQPSWPRCRP